MLPIKPIYKAGRTRKDGTNLIFIQYCLNSDKRILLMYIFIKRYLLLTEEHPKMATRSIGF